MSLNYAESYEYEPPAGAPTDAAGQYRLGLQFAHDGSDGEAVVWLRSAAEQGHPPAAAFLGYMFAHGRGVRQDHGEAVTWFRRSAAQGCDGGQLFLAGAYAHGHGVAADIVEAHVWYNLAAAQGNEAAARCRGIVSGHMTPAQIAAAQRRARGWRMPAMRRGVDTFERADDPMALRALIVRAGHGDVDAQWNLGAMYVGGDGVLKSCAKAARWLRQAADRGHAAAQFLLGWMHRKGEGVPQDDAMALMWWHLAAAQEVRGAAAVRDRFAAIVAREQVAEAQALLDRRRTARRRLN